MTNRGGRDGQTRKTLAFFADRSLHTGEVIGSIPIAPTTLIIGIPLETLLVMGGVVLKAHLQAMARSLSCHSSGTARGSLWLRFGGEELRGKSRFEGLVVRSCLDHPYSQGCPSLGQADEGPGRQRGPHSRSESPTEDFPGGLGSSLPGHRNCVSAKSAPGQCAC